MLKFRNVLSINVPMGEIRIPVISDMFALLASRVRPAGASRYSVLSVPGGHWRGEGVCRDFNARQGAQREGWQ